MKIQSVLVLAIGVLLSGCATKHYGREGELTQYEKSTMNCREIALESAKVDGFVRHVDDESQFNGRSILSFLGDFGIGNVLEKDAALDSAQTRQTELWAISTQRGCGIRTTTSSTE
ncbi:hypothetical protein [Paraburkholderia elongata]|uniref:Lipoprotein n=1 Tax=Paraburkholderia elongata TaxID=2675747 RepID=A0A972NNA1_9BURK|nr:hypothetical protein [Paraburkholderia elongata]NPT54902.1 hypothetical protein [Paraburkholderia elongata]NPT60931.1 hypothetical protein [Paraburkholderia elongata]